MGEVNKTVLITGASSGIGYELAHLFAKDGHSIFAVGRDRRKLELLAQQLKEQYGSLVTIFVQDLAEDLAAEKIVEELQKKTIIIHTLVNNAGAGLWGEFQQNSLQDIEAQLALMRTSVILTHHLITEMITRKEGALLFVGSVYSFTPMPSQSLYSASKSFFLSLARSLSVEAFPYHVKVSILCPGITETAFRSRRGIVDKRGGWISMTAKEVAAIGYKGFKKGKSVIIPGFINKCYVFAGQYIPIGSIKWLIYKIRGLQIERNKTS